MKLILPLPPSINQTYKVGRNRFYSSQASHDYKTEVAQILKFDYKCVPSVKKLFIQFQFFFKRERDISSGLKLIEDAMQGYCYVNDSQIYEEVLIKDFDKLNPRVEVTITEA